MASMALGLLLTGLVIGFSIAAPIGPIGLLCIRRTLWGGIRSGIASGLGVATADLTYGLVAAFGLTLVSNVLMSEIAWLKLAGGLFLLALGIKIFLLKPTMANSDIRPGLASDYLSTLALTLTNPITIISFAAVFVGFGLRASGSSISPAAFALGIFCGSLAWWLILCGIVEMLRSRLDTEAMSWVNMISGIVITVFGLLTLSTVI
jgi:threonine/homoserine/homoserine lactone efflux protein